MSIYLTIFLCLAFLIIGWISGVYTHLKMTRDKEFLDNWNRWPEDEELADKLFKMTPEKYIKYNEDKSDKT